MAQTKAFGQAWNHRMSRLLFVVLLWVAPSCLAQATPGLTEEQIKAGFLFNFLRFVEWPPSAYETPSTPITVCVLGETRIDVLLLETAKGKEIGNRSVLIKRVRANQDLRACHLLFFASNETPRSATLLAKLADAATLTVGDSAEFARAGGVIGFAKEDNRVKLELNLHAATRANLKISAKLISVSRLVSDPHATEGN